MIMDWIRFAIAAILAILGLCSFGSAVLGAYRFGFVLNRMHAAGIGDTAGIFLMIASLAVARGLHMDTLKLVVLVFFLWFTSPVSTHFLGQVEFYTNPLLGRHVKQADLPEPADSPVQAGTEERKKGDGDGTD
jgi:multicomponent Na+:H+ antiporter subunit G